MASSSSSSSKDNSCLHCGKSSSDQLQNGWDLSTGKFAQLCNRCYSIYESGKFCEYFHKEQGDWIDCQFCSKPIHISCLTSFNKWFLLKSHEVLCVECLEVSSFMERNFSNVMENVEGIETHQISRTPKGAVVPLFDILITAATRENYGSVVIPKKHAEAYLPEVSDVDHGVPFTVIDYGSLKNLFLRLRFGDNQTYVLDGFQDYMESKNLQRGDTLKFSRMVPDGPYIVGFRKASTKKSSRKSSNRRRR